MGNLEIQSPTKLPDGSKYQNVYVLDNGGGRIKKFVCRLSQGEKLNETLSKAESFISTNDLTPKFSEYREANCH